MLDKFEIRNYRSCIDTAFDLQPDLTVLIGPNGSGKTNVLTAILLLRKLSDERNSAYYREDESATDECRIKAWFTDRDDSAILTANVALYTDESNADVVVSSKQSWYAKDFTGSGRRINMPLWVAKFFRGDSLTIRGRFFHDRMFHEDVDLEVPDEFRRPLTSFAPGATGVSPVLPPTTACRCICSLSFPTSQVP